MPAATIDAAFMDSRTSDACAPGVHVLMVRKQTWTQYSACDI